jgi:hypothetical protein
MKTITLELFDINELSETAKKKAIEVYRNTNDNYEMEPFKDSSITYLEELGFEGVRLSYSLSCSQGDGVNFSAEKFKGLEKMLLEILGEGKEKTAKIIVKNIEVTMKGNEGRYAFASKSDVDFDFVPSQRLTNIENIVTGVLLEKFENFYMETCKQLEKNGYAEIEYMDSDEYIIDELISNDALFTKEGKRYHE